MAQSANVLKVLAFVFMTRLGMVYGSRLRIRFNLLVLWLRSPTACVKPMQLLSVSLNEESHKDVLT